MTWTIRPEAADDREAVREVNRLAFGREDEGELVEALRAGGFARVSLVAEERGRAIGHILFGDLTIETPRGPVAALALAPMAVVPAAQRRGVGSSLVIEGLRACAELGHRIVVVLGHPEFYPRFGFSAASARGLDAPFSGPALMALALEPGAPDGISGKLRYPPPFGIG